MLRNDVKDSTSLNSLFTTSFKMSCQNTSSAEITSLFSIDTHCLQQTSYLHLNAFHAARMSRRQHKNVTNFVKNVNILEFG